MVNQKQAKGGHANPSRGRGEAEAVGQYAKTDKGRTNSGIASADPRVLSGKKDGDATWPLKRGNDRG